MAKKKKKFCNLKCLVVVTKLNIIKISHFEIKLQLCNITSALICGGSYEASVLLLCGFYFSVSLLSPLHSVWKGLQRHHSNHVSAEIHLSAPSQNNISVQLPSGKIKYLLLHGEMHSRVLSQVLNNPCKCFFFLLQKPIILHQIKGIYL